MQNGRKLTFWQFAAIGACYMMGPILHTSFISATAGRDSWLMPLAGAVFMLPVWAVWCFLIKRHPGLGLYQIHEKVFGSVIGRVFTGFYLFYFINVAALNTMETEVFVSSYILRGTPIIVCGLVCLATCAYAASKGLHVIGRLPAVLVIAALAAIALNFIQAIPQMDIKSLQPVLMQDPKVYVHSAHISSTIMYGEGIGMLVIGGRLHGKADLRKATLYVLLFALLYLTQVHLREVLLLRGLSSKVSLPSFEAVRLTDTSGTVSRTESVYALMMLSFSLFRVLMTFYVSLDALRLIFRLNNFKSLILPCAALIALYSMMVLQSPEDSFFYGINTIPFVWNVFTFVLPLITLIVSLLRGKTPSAGNVSVSVRRSVCVCVSVSVRTSCEP